MNQKWHITRLDDNHIIKSTDKECSICDRHVLVQKDVFINPMDGKQTTVGIMYYHDSPEEEEQCLELKKARELLDLIRKGGRL